MNQGRQDQGPSAEAVVRYRLLAPDLFTPPREHRRLGASVYLAPYEPRLEMLDTMRVIDVVDWGDS